MKVLIFDTSAIITLALSNLLYLFPPLKKSFDGKLIITKEVKYETIDKPLEIKKYELEALMILQLLKEGILEMPTVLAVNEQELEAKTEEVMKKANTTFFVSREPITLLGKGEASCIALSKILQEKKIMNVVVIDERTARMLCEKPNNLHKLLEKKLHVTIKAIKNNYEYFRNIKIIRSAELCYVALKKNFVGIKNGVQLIDALLYATKYKGCAISQREIEEIKKL